MICNQSLIIFIDFLAGFAGITNTINYEITVLLLISSSIKTTIIFIEFHFVSYNPSFH